MSIASQLTLLAQTKETQRKLLGLSTDVPFSQYHFYMQRHPDAAIKTLYTDGKQGVWLDPSDLSTMFQNANGTVPVTTDGDPVGLIRDKSGNSNHATQTVSAARPIYKTDGILHWLAFDGIDDYMPLNYPVGKYELWASTRAYTTSTLARYFVDYRPQNIQYAYQSTIEGDTFLSGSIKLLTEDFVKPFQKDKVTGLQLDFNSERGNLFTRTSGAEAFKGRLYGLIKIESTVSLDQRQSINDYLTAKSGVTL